MDEEAEKLITSTKAPSTLLAHLSTDAAGSRRRSAVLAEMTTGSWYQCLHTPQCPNKNAGFFLMEKLNLIPCLNRESPTYLMPYALSVISIFLYTDEKSLVSGLIINRYPKESSILERFLDAFNAERRRMLKDVHFDGQVESAINDLHYGNC